jgi:xanthine/CO dehydrogenase XdhC/CoxF family maturation factor
MTDELTAMIALAKRLLASGTGGTLSTLFSTRGSTYRPLGSMMVSLPGMHAGGVSGGCLEEYVARVGERATRTAPAVMLRFSTHPDSEDDAPVLGCGGSIEVLVERLTPEHVGFLEGFASASESDNGSTLACRVKREGESLSVTREWLQSECRPAADPDLLVHHIPPVTRLLIFGAGDDAMPLCDIGASLGWHVSVVDRRARLATTARFPNARAVVANEWEEAVDALVVSPRTAAVLMTHSLDDDARVLALLSRRQLSYLGALGPAHRRQWLIDQASAYDATRGDPVAMKVHGPIGLDLGDRSAAGIAVAAAAEILARLNHRDARPLDHAGEVPRVESHRRSCLVA